MVEKERLHLPKETDRLDRGLLFDPYEIKKRILQPYLKGEFEITDATPPWIRIIVRFNKGPITKEVIDNAVRAGGTTDPDPYFT